MHKLRHYRESYGLSVRDLSILSDISMDAIYRIEKGNSPYKTNDGVALALANALDVEVHTLFSKDELSQLGRPPHTGKPINLHAASLHETICEHCHLVVPRGVDCDCAA